MRNIVLGVVGLLLLLLAMDGIFVVTETEPTARFQMRGRQVRCLRTDPGLGCNEQPKARQPEPSQQEIVFA